MAFPSGHTRAIGRCGPGNVAGNRRAAETRRLTFDGKSRQRRPQVRFWRRSKPGDFQGWSSPTRTAPPIVHVIAYGPDQFVEERVTDCQQVQRAWSTRRPSRGSTSKGWGCQHDSLDRRTVSFASASARGRRRTRTSGPKRSHIRILVHRGPDGQLNERRKPTDQLVSWAELRGHLFGRPGRRIRLSAATFAQFTGRRAAQGRLPGVCLVRCLVDGYFPVVEAYGERLDALEDEVVGAPSRADDRLGPPGQTGLAYVRPARWPLAKRSIPGPRPHRTIDTETRVYLRDCLRSYRADHRHRRDISASSMPTLTDLYLSSLSNRLNEVMKV